MTVLATGMFTPILLVAVEPAQNDTLDGVTESTKPVQGELVPDIASRPVLSGSNQGFNVLLVAVAPLLVQL